MRISDWSSDVCSSDLLFLEEGDGGLLLAPAAAPLGAKADLLGERATLLGIAGCDDRITLRQVPLGAILVGRHAVISCEMAPQRLHLLSVFGADELLGLHQRPVQKGRLLLAFGLLFFVKAVLLARHVLAVRRNIEDRDT